MISLLCQNSYCVFFFFHFWNSCDPLFETGLIFTSVQHFQPFKKGDFP